MSVSPLLSTLGDAFAVLCVLAIMPWIMGIPGNAGGAGKESDYTRGWKMGLDVIVVYPLVRVLDVAGVWGARLLVSAATQIYIENFIASFNALIFLLALARLGWAFRVLIRD